MKHSIGRSWVFLEGLLKTQNLDKLDSKEKTVWMVEVESKLVCSLEFLGAFKEHSDITNSPKEDFQNVWSKITVCPPVDVKKLKKDTLKAKNMLHTAVSAVLSEQKRDFKLTKILAFGFSFPRYTIMSDSGKLKS